MPAGEIARRGHWLDQRLSRSRSPSTRLAARTVQTRTLRTPSRTTTKQTGVPPQTSQECYGWSQPLQLSFKSYSVYCRNCIASMRQLCLLGEQRSHSETCDFPAGSSVLRSLNHQFADPSVRFGGGRRLRYVKSKPNVFFSQRALTKPLGSRLPFEDVLERFFANK